ncbi:MAG TPA: zinc dependent phospholipase C family protein [Geopsychrobacteraceae bacterium]|nr:zinc dependent phospholipase C family protein [Geopsychrobacteraceae bacterium]
MLCLLIILLGIPTQALAWGVGVHLTLGANLLGRLDVLPIAMQTLLAAYPLDFLYGCIAADITLGKKFTHHLEHCHNWRIGRKILSKADTPQMEACAYGYLAHLAADTVAHSYFVPFKMVQTFNTVMLKHTYWELRAETGTEEEVWSLVEQIAQNDYRRHDKMLSSVLSDTIFSFRTNKRLFNSLLLLNRLQQWKKLLDSISVTSKWEFDPDDKREYMELADDAIAGILSSEESHHWNADPTGDRALNAAKLIRKNLNSLWLDGKLQEREAEAILEDLRQCFRRGITNPDEMLKLQSAF